ncbi:unnamed protein product [Pleuronectes platessa]|uniref:Uncharacterized protein n=1 Tax=Pleuronectes platessa TaxID=8262 RepID=A0A9N7W1Q8_PLEPL|nr:unnamed protein product [Pleuronectes platessa]
MTQPEMTGLITQAGWSLEQSSTVFTHTHVTSGLSDVARAMWPIAKKGSRRVFRDRENGQSDQMCASGSISYHHDVCPQGLTGSQKPHCENQWPQQACQQAGGYQVGPTVESLTGVREKCRFTNKARFDPRCSIHLEV